MYLGQSISKLTYFQNYLPSIWNLSDNSLVWKFGHFWEKKLKIERILLPSTQNNNILINKIKGFNTQDGNDTILNVIGNLYVTSVLVSILVVQKIIPSRAHPLFMVNTMYALTYVPSLVIPITFAIIWPKSIKIGFQALPCFN
jgi:hypothetical protein